MNFTAQCVLVVWQQATAEGISHPDSFKGVVGMTNLQEIITGYRTNFQKQRLMAMKAAKSVKDYFYWVYYQFLLITCCIDMEPWEQAVLHAGLVTITTMLLFTAYVFIPMHLRLAFRFFLQLLVN